MRGAYQTLFARGLVRKTYLARAAVDPDLEFPKLLRSRIIKRRGQLQAVEEPGEPNAETLVEHLGDGLYRLTHGRAAPISCACTWPRWVCRSSEIRCIPT